MVTKGNTVRWNLLRIYDSLAQLVECKLLNLVFLDSNSLAGKEASYFFCRNF